MNPQATAAFHRDKCAWENAINTNHDPFELWFNYISWYEQNRQNDVENKFRSTLERCLSQYEHDESHKQDLRMVKLWMKYIDMQQNPLHLYQLLYQRNIGTQLSAFYIGWAHYYDAANAYKQAESVYNLGFQAKAQPVEEIQEAHKKFRLSVSQRMLYDDNLSKKRAASNLIDQRNVITSLNPPTEKKKVENEEYYEKPYNNNCVATGATTINPSQSDDSNRINNTNTQSTGYAYNQSNNGTYVEPENETKCDLNNSGFMIAASLNSVYDDTVSYETVEEVQEVAEEVVIAQDDGIILPENFARIAKNNYESWDAPLCLDEPYDPNRKCYYPKTIVYPGDGNEYSLDEIKAKKYEKRRSEILLEQKRTEMLKLQQQQHQLQLQQQQLQQQRLQQQQQKQMQQQQQLQAQSVSYGVSTAQVPQPIGHVYENNPVQQQAHHHYQYNTPQQQHPNYVQQQAIPTPHASSYYHPQHNQNIQPQHIPMHSPSPQPLHHPMLSPVPPTQPQMPPNTPNHYSPHHPNHFPAQPTQYYHHSSPQPPVNHQSQQQQHPHHQYSHSATYHAAQAPQTPPVQYYNHQMQPQPPQAQHQYQMPTNNVALNGSVSNPQYSNYSISQTTVTSATEDTPQRGQKRKKDDEFDYDEQIEASTIQYYPNSSVKKPQTIRIKFKKEKPNNIESSPNVPSPTVSGVATPKPMKTPTTSTPKTSRKSKKLKAPPIDSGFVPSSESNSTDSQRYNKNNIDDANLLLSIANMHSSSNDDSSQSYSYQQKQRAPAPIEPFINDDSFSNSSFNGYSENSNSTPIKANRFNNSQKLATPLQNFKYQNDDSNCSFSGEQNSYFATESDEEAKGRRLEKALEIIKSHFVKPLLDPFSNELCKAFLTKLDFPPRNDRDVCQVINAVIPKINQMKVTTLGDTTYHVEKEVGRGAYGAVYRGVNTTTGDIVALKYQKPGTSWELYICTEVRKRIVNHDMLPGFMGVSSSIVGRNASVLVSEFSQYGSLLDINNRIRTATTKVMHESLVMHFTSQILSVIDHLHSCKIIHADIKPDNFLLMKIPTSDSHVPTLRLIDFGCAIDMTLFDEGTQFKKVIQTDGFTCIEMQEGRPWSYQTDLFCVAGTVHVMLFGEYMQIVKRFGTDWDIKQKLPRYLKKNVWTSFFSKLLNITDIHHLPDLKDLKAAVDDELYNMESELQKHIRTLSNILHKR